MRHGSLFSGLGGFDLAAEWMGWENIFHCEKSKFLQQVLKYYWPDAELFEDISKTDFTKYHGKIDIISGGFPCQPYSSAGERKGKNDDRHLWPQMLRAIREIQPCWVVGENVSGILNWSGGMVLDEIKADLEGEGFEVFPPCILPACAKNAPHRRDRVFIIAYNPSIRRLQSKQDNEAKFSYKNVKDVVAANSNNVAEQCNSSNTGSEGLQSTSLGQQPSISEPAGQSQGSKFSRAFTENEGWRKFPTQSPVCSRDDGISTGLVGITFPKHRAESIQAYGNAIVPQIAYELFKAIDKLHKDEILTEQRRTRFT